MASLAFNNGGLVLGRRNAAGLPEVFQLGVVQLPSGLLADDRATGKDGDVFKHGLAAVAEAGGLYRQDV